MLINLTKNKFRRNLTRLGFQFSNFEFKNEMQYFKRTFTK